MPEEMMRGPFGPKRFRDTGKDVPILKQKLDEPTSPQPTADEPNPFPAGFGPDAQIKWLGTELRGGFMALFNAMRDINESIDAANPRLIPHVPCVVPVHNPDGQDMGFGVFCFHCSYVKHAGDPQMVWCEEPDVDLSTWPPRRLIAAPEFVEEAAGGGDS